MQTGEHGPKCGGAPCTGCVPHPMRAEVDEIVPISLGGSPYERSNCRLTHRICNQKRGNGTTPRTPTDTTGMPVSNVW
ncbi:HNH endonuclease [Cellulosimicrobium cellulans]|uniref:HNH endonuclease n=1 Tax=Cellulosimicrobium cellulans TaxID=1710 RepID=UPI003C566570